MSAPTPDARRHGAASASTLAAGLLGVTVALAGELSPGYDHRYDTVSRLASPGQPFATAVRAAIVAAGVLVVVTATTLREPAGNDRRPVRLLIGLAGAATVVVGIAPKDPPDVDPTTTSQLHVAAALTGVTALAAAMAHVTQSGPRRIERRRAAGALAVIATAGAAFPFAWGTIAYGLLQRVVLLTALAWLVATARHSRHEPRHRHAEARQEAKRSSSSASTMPHASRVPGGREARPPVGSPRSPSGPSPGRTSRPPTAPPACAVTKGPGQQRDEQRR